MPGIAAVKIKLAARRRRILKVERGYALEFDASLDGVPASDPTQHLEQFPVALPVAGARLIEEAAKAVYVHHRQAAQILHRRDKAGDEGAWIEGEILRRPEIVDVRQSEPHFVDQRRGEQPGIG